MLKLVIVIPPEEVMVRLYIECVYSVQNRLETSSGYRHLSVQPLGLKIDSTPNQTLCLFYIDDHFSSYGCPNQTKCRQELDIGWE